MGAGQSGGIEIGGSPMGYQVLRVYPDSPGSQAGLKAYFDFIVAIGQTRFDKENGSLREILKASIDQKLKMVVYNTRSKVAREVEIVPSTSWGGSGLLGVSIKHCSFDRADERVWHVIEVDPGSPAQQAGFRPGQDYVIGSDSILQENDDLYNLIETHEGKALKLFVYNSETDNCREIICYPNSKWGGRGYLGCEFGHGLLHRIPYVEKQPSQVKALPAGDSNHLLASGASNIGVSSQQMVVPQAGAHNAQTILGSNQSRPSLVMPSTIQAQPAPTQPGHQMLQQVLFDNQAQTQQQQQQPLSQAPNLEQAQPYQQQQQQQQQPQRPQVSAVQAPQTFAQLANAQFMQSQQYQKTDQSYAPPNPYQPQQPEVPQPTAMQQTFVQQVNTQPVESNHQYQPSQHQIQQQHAFPPTSQYGQQQPQHPYQAQLQAQQSQSPNGVSFMQQPFGPYQHQFQHQPPAVQQQAQHNNHYQQQQQQQQHQGPFVAQKPQMSEQVAQQQQQLPQPVHLQAQPSNPIQNQPSNAASPSANQTPGSWLSGPESADAAGQMLAEPGSGR